ncbi:flavin monoamine oxidase family protein [Capillimicrobium parvum]|uniref:Pseudooxynicotine oxidase n=1 Tax=Capillimicrobium parvum TaxID=2884022 RepID=A0A9E6XWV9_9ACTN|nr:NAD(P)/FAD-dependent oxidoreductase [Capillimicrobium parvum]UGS36011.1 Pseudooxynicotine oxidase [Capillimicrobium parvum]
MGSDFDVIVVGGGLSGIRAARDLGDAGHSVLVLEARDRLGGRAWTRPFAGREELVEIGGTWVAPEVHPHVADEIARYDLELVVSHGGDLDSRWHFGGELKRHFPLEGDDIYALERTLFQIIRASHRVDPDRPRDEQDLADLDVSVERFLDDLGTPAAVREFIYMWAGLGSGALPGEWSMLTALSLIAAMDNSVWGWYGAVTDRFVIGMSAVVDLLARDSGARIELSAPVSRVEQDDEGVRVTTAAGATYRAPAVVIATPLAVWPDIEFSPALPEDKMEPARAGNPGRMKKTWMVVENLPPNLFASGWGTDFVQMFPELERPDGAIAMGMCAPPSELDVSDLDALTRAVRQFAPEADVVAADAHDFAADPYAKGTWLVNPPGMLSAHHSALGRPEGRIVFAGADVAVRWIGWLDGALEAGARAAEQARAVLGGALPVG